MYIVQFAETAIDPTVNVTVWPLAHDFVQPEMELYQRGKEAEKAMGESE